MSKKAGNAGKSILAELGLVSPVVDSRDGLSPDKVEPSDPIRNRPERSNELVSERAKDKDKAEIRDAPVDQIGHGEQYD
jgi:hypothetical protein